jgi:hypothetical protein
VMLHVGRDSHAFTHALAHDAARLLNAVAPCVRGWLWGELLLENGVDHATLWDARERRLPLELFKFVLDS